MKRKISELRRKWATEMLRLAGSIETQREADSRKNRINDDLYQKLVRGSNEAFYQAELSDDSNKIYRKMACCDMEMTRLRLLSGQMAQERYNQLSRLSQGTLKLRFYLESKYGSERGLE